MSRVSPSVAIAGVLAALVTTACGKPAPTTAGEAGADQTSTTRLTATTPAATKPVGKITWALYRNVGTVDPNQAFDYPENTVVTALCDALVRQQPDGTLAGGISALPRHPDDTTTVLDLDPAARFWNGKPVTPADVVFGLERAADAKSGGFYSAAFTRVESIRETGAHQVTIKLERPDYWLDGELSGMPGVVVEKAYVHAKGKSFGTSTGGTMCSGPYKVGSWKAGTSLNAVANTAYWSTPKPKVTEIDFKGVPDEASLTTGLLTGDIDGTYPQAIGSLDQLKANNKVTVTAGPAFSTDAIVISSLEGALGDVRVRRALSLAIDRKSYIGQVEHGYGQLPRTLANPGTWGYGRKVFEEDWNRLADPTRDVDKAKALIKEAGATGKTLTVGMTPEVNNIVTTANAVRQAGQAIGLDVKFKAVSAQNYINFFTDPKARQGVDGFPTINYPDYADPAAFYNSVVSPDGSQNFSGFEDARINDLLSHARSTADPDSRARLVARAGDRIMQLLPWIPMAQPNQVLLTRKGLTGAPTSFVYMGGPWANLLGGE